MRSAASIRLLGALADLEAQLRALRAEAVRYTEECDEAHELLDFAERARGRIEWGPSKGITLRDALREAKRQIEGGQ